MNKKLPCLLASVTLFAMLSACATKPARNISVASPVLEQSKFTSRVERQNRAITISQVADTAPIAAPDPAPDAQYAIERDLVSLFKEFTDVSNRVLPGYWRYEIDTEIIPVSGQKGRSEVSATFKLVSDRSKNHFFRPGGYLIDSAQGASYIAFVTGAISEVSKRFGAHHEILILVDYLGGSDGLPYRSTVPYRGQLGTVHIPKSELLVNGRPAKKDFYLQAGTSLTNRSLAILRAFSIAWHIQHAPNRDQRVLQQIQQARFIATTHSETGQAFRYARIQLKIKQRPLQLTPAQL